MEKNRYIVRQAIKDANSRILGYEIMYSGGHEAYGEDNSSEGSAAQAIYDFLTQNSEKALKDSNTFMTFTNSLLTKRTPHLFQNTNLVIQIDDSVVIHPLAVHLVQQYAKEGYRIAVNDFQFAPRYMALLEHLAYIKINLKSLSQSSAENIMRVADSMKKRVIATGIDSQELFDRAKGLGVYGMQGSYVADKLANKVYQSGYLRSNFLRLVAAANREEPDIHELEQIISMDVTLSYSLLKIANSAYYALRTKTTSVQQAIMTLGLSQLKRWIYLLGTGGQDDESFSDSEEFIKMSFMRGSFASELRKYIKNPALSASDAYLLGMFSTLEYLMDEPMEEILADIPMSDELRKALVEHEGDGGKVLDLILSYEKADWERTNMFAEEIGLPQDKLTSIYFDCMQEVNSIWDQMMKSSLQEERPTITLSE